MSYPLYFTPPGRLSITLRLALSLYLVGMTLSIIFLMKYNYDTFGACKEARISNTYYSNY